VAPDLSPSTLGCTDTGGGTLQLGDDLTCTLYAGLAAGTENATITGTIGLPPSVEFAEAPATYDATTRTIPLNATVLGFTFSGQGRLLKFHVTVSDSLAVGDPVTLSVDLTGVGDVDAAVVQRSVSSAVLTVAPPPADLAGTTVGCQDLNGPPLLPGEQVSCTVDVVNAAGHEDAGFVGATLTLNGTTWLSGGTSFVAGSTQFGVGALGNVASGTDKAVTATFIVPVTALGGDPYAPFAFVAGSSAPSLTQIFLTRTGPPLVVSPGPAVLVQSALVCDDTNGGVLLAGDDVTCSVVVRPSVGYEGVASAAAVVTIPNGASYVSGADEHDASSVSFAPSSLGDVAAGDAATADFHMRISTLATQGTQLHPTGTISAVSVPLGGPVSQPLDGTALIVGKQVLQPGEQPTIPDTVTPPVERPPAPSTTYGLRAKTIRMTLRRGHRRKNHLWRGSTRRFVFVKKFVVRTPKISGKVVNRVTVPKKGKWRPKYGIVKIRGTRLTYSVKKGKRRTDRFHYTVTDTAGKKATGTVIVQWERKKK